MHTFEAKIQFQSNKNSAEKELITRGLESATLQINKNQAFEKVKKEKKKNHVAKTRNKAFINKNKKIPFRSPK